MQWRCNSVGRFTDSLAALIQFMEQIQTRHLFLVKGKFRDGRQRHPVDVEKSLSGFCRCRRRMIHGQMIQTACSEICSKYFGAAFPLLRRQNQKPQKRVNCSSQSIKWKNPRARQIAAAMVARSFCGGEFHVHRHTGAQDLSGWLEQAGFGVNAKNRDRLRFLVSNNQPTA